MVSKGYHFYILRMGPFLLTYFKIQRKGFLSFKTTHANYLWNRNYHRVNLVTINITSVFLNGAFHSKRLFILSSTNYIYIYCATTILFGTFRLHFKLGRPLQYVDAIYFQFL